MITVVRARGRGWAYLGALLGGAASIAANVAHSYVPPAGVAGDWSPQIGAVVSAVFWPVALFVAVEILARTVWPAGRLWVLLRFAGLLPVALVAAVVSYRHLSGLLAFYRTEDALTMAIGPLAVDGLMIMATGALIANGHRRPAPAPAATPVEPAAAPAATPAAPAPAPTGPGAGGKSATKPARPRSALKPPSADKVAKAAAKMPGATVAAIAAKAGVSESTARRYLPATFRPAGDAAVASANPPRPATTPAPATA